MELDLDDRDRLARTLLAALLGVLALRSFRNGNRLRGTLVGAGAAAVGYTSTGSDDALERLDVSTDEAHESPDEDGPLRCAVCGDAITTGQRRRPNEDDQIVHETCLETPA